MPDVKATLINSNPQEISDDDWLNICQEVFDLVVELSPVDTGEFKSAWEFNVISNDIIEIYNPLEYASFLEDGWSEQAPDGVLQVAIEDLPSILQSYLNRKPTGEVTVSIEIPDYVAG